MVDTIIDATSFMNPGEEGTRDGALEQGHFEISQLREDRASDPVKVEEERIKDAAISAHDKRIKENIKREQSGERGLFSSMFKAVGIGATDFVNEVDRFTGISGFLKNQMGIDIQLGEDTILYDTERELNIHPSNTFEALVATASQFAIPFGSLGKVGKVGTTVAGKIAPKFTTKMAALAAKSPKIAMAADAMIRGGIVDAAAFDPKDPNAGNLLLSMKLVSEDSTAGGLIKEYLATDPNDPDASNRARNVLTGVVAGVITEGLFRIAKAGVKGASKAISRVELKDAAEETANALVDHFDEVRAASPEGAERIKSTLPDLPEGSAKGTGEGTLSPVAREGSVLEHSYEHQFSGLSPEQMREAADVLKRLAKGETVDITDPHLPFNLNKVRAPEDIKQTSFAIGKIINKDLPRHVPLSQKIQEFSDLMGLEPAEFTEHLKRVTRNTEEASAYIEGSKAVAALQAQKALASAKEFITNPGIDTQFKYNAAIVEAAESHHAVSGLGTAFGQGLARFKNVSKLGDIMGQADMLRMDLLNKALDATKGTAKLRAARMIKLHSLDAEKSAILQQRLLNEEKLFKGKSLEQVTRDILNAEFYQLRGFNNYINKGITERGRDALLEVYVNGLLSNPKTFIVNAVGNVSAIGTSAFERLFAGIRNNSVDGVSIGESVRLMMGYWESMKDVPRIFSKALRQGPDNAMVKTDFMKPHDRALSKEAFNVGGGLGKTIDVFGSVTNLPGKLLLAADEAFKYVNYNAQRNALAHRKALQALGKFPKTKAEMQSLMQLRAKYLDDDSVLEASHEFAKINTFTNNLYDREVVDASGKVVHVAGMTKAFQRIIEADPTGMMKVFIPFFKTPANLLRYSAQRVPGLNKFSAVLRQELQSPDKAVRQLAQAKTATGSFILGTSMWYGWNGLVTGAPPSDAKLAKRWEEAGWKPYAIYNPTEGTYTSYNRFDPLGILMALGANMATLAKSTVGLSEFKQENGMTDELYDQYTSLYADSAFAIGRLVADRHYLQGFGMLADAVSGDPHAWKQIGRSLGLALNPFNGFYSSLRRGIKRGFDPEKEEDRRSPLDVSADTEPLDRFMQEGVKVLSEAVDDTIRSIPGFGERLPAKLNLVGEPTYYPGGEKNAPLWNMANALVNPFDSTTITENPLLLKIAELDVSLESAEETDNIEGVELNNEEQHFFASEWGKMNRKLESWVQSNSFNNLSETVQQELLKKRLLVNRKVARKKTLIQFPRIQEKFMGNKKAEFGRRSKDLPLNNLQKMFTPKQ